MEEKCLVVSIKPPLSRHTRKKATHGAVPFSLAQFAIFEINLYDFLDIV